MLMVVFPVVILPTKSIAVMAQRNIYYAKFN